MKALDILKLMGEFGVRYHDSYLDTVIDYVGNMLRDGRILIIEDNGEPTSILFFSIDDDWGRFYKKKTWDYVPHFPCGDTAYIEIFISRFYNRNLRNLIESKLLEKFPVIKRGIWHRWASWGDRKVIRRVRNHV